MSSQNSCDYADVISGREEVEGWNSEGSSDQNLSRPDKIDDPKTKDETYDNSSTNKNIPHDQQAINNASSGFQIAMNNMWALIRSHDKTNVQDDESKTSKKFSGDSHSVSDSSPQLPKELPSRNKVHSEFSPQNKAHSELPPQNKTHPEPIPQTDSSSLVAKPQDNNPAENPHPSNVVQRNETKDGWAWSVTKGLVSGCWSLCKILLSDVGDILKWYLSLSMKEKLSLLTTIYGIYRWVKFQKFIDKLQESCMKLWGQAKDTATATGEPIADASKVVGTTLEAAKDKVKETAHQAKEGVVNVLQGEFKVITLDGAKKLIKEGKNDELQGYLIYANQITYGTQPELSQTEIKIETEEKKLEETEETAQEKKLEAPEGENLVQNTLHRQLLEEAITCHNLGAVKLLLKHDKSLMQELGEGVAGVICNTIKDSEAKFQGVDIKGDHTLLPKAMLKLFDLRKTISQCELSHSFVRTTQEVTLENIGKVEITFEKIDEDPYWMRANCVVNKGTKDEYSIKLFCKIAQEGTQITNGEIAQVNVLESEEFEKFLTKSINDYHDALNIIDCLLKQGADPSVMITVEGLQYDIPLGEAFYENNIELFIVLLKNRAKPTTDLITYTFNYKDPPESDNKPFYKLLSSPHCNGLGVQLWEACVLPDPAEDENNVREPTVRSVLKKEQPTQEQSSNKKIFSEEEIHYAVLIYDLSQPTSNVTNINSSLGKSLECISRAQLPAANPTTSQPVVQPILKTENIPETEEDIREKYHISNDQGAPQLPPATPPENKEISPPSTDKVATQSQSADGQKLDGNRLKHKEHYGKSYTKLPASQGCQLQLANPSSGQVVIYGSNAQAQVTQKLVKGNTYLPPSKDTPGMKPLTFNTPQYPGSPDHKNKEIATTSEISVTAATSPKNPDNQPLVVIELPPTPEKPPNIENSTLVPSSQGLPVVIASPKNQNSQNDIVSIPKSDEMLYKDLSSKQRMMWQQDFAKNMIQGFIQLNNISPELVNFEKVTECLQKIMDDSKALLKFKNDILQHAQKSDSNHQNPFLIMMYGEEKARELSSNPQVLNISQDSCMWVLKQFDIYISITDPLRYAHITRGVNQTINENGETQTQFLDIKKLNEEYKQEIQKNNNEKLLLDKLENNNIDLLELYGVIHNIRQKGLSTTQHKALVGGERVSEIILNCPKTVLRHAVKVTAITINNAINPKNYEIVAHGAKLLIGNGVESMQKRIAGSVPFLSLTGGKKANEPIASNHPFDLKGLFFVNGQFVKGANPLRNFSGYNKVPSVPTDEETKEETSKETPVVLDNSGTSGDDKKKGDTESSDDILPETDSKTLEANLKKQNPIQYIQGVKNWLFGSANVTSEVDTSDDFFEEDTSASPDLEDDPPTDEDNSTNSSKESEEEVVEEVVETTPSPEDGNGNSSGTNSAEESEEDRLLSGEERNQAEEFFEKWGQ